MNKIKVGVVVGSLRRDSYTKSIARALIAFLPQHMEAAILDIGHLPLFNQDYDDDNAAPPEWTAFRAQVQAMDAYIFLTPEHNRSYPAAIKNALDIASRPYGSNGWGGKPGAVISVSPGKPGAFGANHHLRQAMSFLDIYLMQQPEAYIGGVADSLDAAGRVISEGLNGFLRSIAEAYAWVARFVSQA